MHDTREKGVKGYIDEIRISELCINFSGWCFHEKEGMCDIRSIYILNNNSCIISYNEQDRILREDVSKVYDRVDIIKCGWDIMIEKNKEDVIKEVEFQIFIDNSWKTIFCLDLKKKKIDERKKYIPSFIVVDNFYEDPFSIRKIALSQKYQLHPNYHKGKRTEQVFRFEGLKEKFENILNHKIKNWDTYPVNACFQFCIGGDQLVYHVDLQQYAGIIFLTPDAPHQAGTSFYRSKYTKKNKVETIDHDIVFKNGFLDSTEFELVDVIGNTFNRLVLFDAQMIHAASTYFGNCLENGRLFQIFFFDLE